MIYRRVKMHSRNSNLRVNNLEPAHTDEFADGRSSITNLLAEDVGTDIRTALVRKATVPLIGALTRVGTISFLNTHISIVPTPTTCTYPTQQSTTLSLIPQFPTNTRSLSLRHLHRRYFLLSLLSGSIDVTTLCTSRSLNSSSRTSGSSVQIRYGFGVFVGWRVGTWGGYLGRLLGMRISVFGTWVRKA